MTINLEELLFNTNDKAYVIGEQFECLEGHCAYVAVALHKVFQSNGLKAQLVLCTGIREEYGEEVYSLIHCYNRVFNTASGTWEVDATDSMRLELLSECDIGQEWINTWKEVNKVNNDRAFIDLYVEPNEDFWEECDFNGSAYNEELIAGYREQLTRLIESYQQ